MKIPYQYCSLLLLFTGMAAAQPAITDVVNAASRIGSGLPGYGIAQGALFVVTGSNVGTDPLQQASFPLPTTDGISGVTIQITAGGNTTNAIMVYVSSKEVGAILPSSTPTGAATITLNNNGQTATATITVVDSAFGIFTQSQSGSGPAIAQNLAGDGTATANTLSQSAQPGGSVILPGTGLGRMDGDETASTSPATVDPSLQVFVGGKAATIVSKNRGGCCAGLDPNTFPIPQGVAGADQITIQVPDGVSGCYVPVVVQTGNLVSNFATISVSANGGACSDPNGLTSDDLQTIQSNGSFRLGTISLTRSTMKLASIPGFGDLSSKTDSGSANFSQVDWSNLQISGNPFNMTPMGACTVFVFKGKQGDTPVAGQVKSTALDAGPVINITGPKGVKQLTKREGGGYYAELGKDSGMPSGIPGLPGGGASTLFLDKGTYTADNGAGTDQVGAFKVTLNVPDPLVWTNQDSITSVARASGVTINWTGGDPQGFVQITGMSANKDLIGMFICSAPTSAGTFAVPSYVLLALPPSEVQGTGKDAIATGLMTLSSMSQTRFSATGLDVGYFDSSASSMKMPVGFN